MKPAWYSAALRWMASVMNRFADRMDAASFYAPRLDSDAGATSAEHHVFELRTRLSRYY